MARKRRTHRRSAKGRVVCKRIKKVGMRKVRIMANGKWRFVKGKCRA